MKGEDIMEWISIILVIGFILFALGIFAYAMWEDGNSHNRNEEKSKQLCSEKGMTYAGFTRISTDRPGTASGKRISIIETLCLKENNEVKVFYWKD